MGLEIKNLIVELQQEEILHQINLSIEEGELVALLGESGCGKTTLLKTVAGLLDAEKGEICWNGESMLEIAPEKRGTVIVFQDLRLFPHMTVEKNIAFPMELKKIPKEEQKKKISRLLEAVQLPGYEKRKIREMSGGQMQRVALARALAANPKVLLLDEPFSGLDERLRLEMGSLVRKLHEEWKITTILVTHDKREALQMADRIALMRDGEIVQYDTPEDIFYHPKSKNVANYFGKANYIEGKVSCGVFESYLGEWKCDQPDGNYAAMIRPFELQVEKNENGYLVSDIIFMGETAEVMIETENGMIISQVMSSEIKQKELAVNCKVSIEIKQSDFTFFEM